MVLSVQFFNVNCHYKLLCAPLRCFTRLNDLVYRSKRGQGGSRLEKGNFRIDLVSMYWFTSTDGLCFKMPITRD